MKEVFVFWLTGFVLGFALGLSLPAHSAPLTESQARGIYAVAYGQYQGPREWLDRPPTVHVVSPDKLCEIARARPGCAIQGFYLDANVFIRDTLDFETLQATAVLLHEFVHHFQFLQYGRAKDCIEFMDREEQAYLIEANVLEQAGDYRGASNALRMVGRYNCI